MKRYEWAAGSPFSGDADEIQAEIERIKRLPGGATPDALLACAKPKRSILNPLIFHVPETEAAGRYYRNRAVSLLNSIRIVNEEGETTHLRANIRITEGQEATYGSIDDESARRSRDSWLRGRLISIQQELKELGLYPQIAFAIEQELIAA